MRSAPLLQKFFAGFLAQNSKRESVSIPRSEVREVRVRWLVWGRRRGSRRGIQPFQVQQIPPSRILAVGMHIDTVASSTGTESYLFAFSFFDLYSSRESHRIKFRVHSRIRSYSHQHPPVLFHMHAPVRMHRAVSQSKSQYISIESTVPYINTQSIPNSNFKWLRFPRSLTAPSLRVVCAALPRRFSRPFMATHGTLAWSISARASSRIGP